MVEAFYPKKIRQRLSRPLRYFGDMAEAVGSAAAIECGTHIRFEVRLDPEVAKISDLAFTANGCGFMVAAADVLTEAVQGRCLAELHGLDASQLARAVAAKLGAFPLDRNHCLKTAIDALRAAFVDLRRRRIDEFTGEKGLVCTCFSVTEDTIEYLVLKEGKTSVAAIGEACNAGTGCGSCQPIIRDILDALRSETV